MEEAYIFVILILPGIILCILEGLLTALTRIGRGRFVIPALVGVVLLILLIRCETVTGWDSLFWSFCAMMAAFSLIGSLVGCALGQRFKKGHVTESQDETEGEKRC